MVTAIVSDLHLGTSSRADLLRRAALRERLLAELEGVDRVVLLGDIIELRDRPLGEALERSRPFFEDLGAAIGDAELVLVPGNHDYQLLDPWLQRRRLSDRPEPLGLEQRIGPAGGVAQRLAAWAGPERTTLAYPGLFVRDDVYATHGQYLDCHVTVPTVERLALGAIGRLTGGLREGGPRTPEDYESIEAPLYALLFVLAQRRRDAAEGPRRPTPSMRIWAAIGGATGRARTLRGHVLGSAVIPGAIGIANRLGLGRLRSDLSLEEINRAAVRAMAETVERLGIGAEHVIFGHTHRRGPLPGEESANVGPDWTAGKTRLHNTGSWTYAPVMLGSEPEQSPFWPGTLVEVAAEGPPRGRNLLTDLDHAGLRAALRERR